MGGRITIKKDFSKPKINQINNNIQPAVSTVQPTISTIPSNGVPESVQHFCKDGDIIRSNVKPCSADLECYSLTPISERYCRLPDGTCKFFCTEK
jgi:hypothetical protein